MKVRHLLLGLLLTAAPAQAQPLEPEAAGAALAASAEAARTAWADMGYEAFRDSLLYLPDVGKWIVNGDVPIRNEKLLREFFERNVKVAPAVPAGEVPEFTIAQVGGLDQVWGAHLKRALTYCVSSAFGARYDAVVADMAAAAEAWEASADIDFSHRVSEDADCSPQTAAVVFDVGPMTQQGSLLAVAFFPNEPRSARTLRINDTAFRLPPAGNLTLRGILRHELGHVVGARHEHTRPDAGTCFEDDDWRGVTDYDALSVMHYPHCNGFGDWTLTLTAADRSGAACIYGPAPGFVIDVSICTPQAGVRRFGPFELAAGASTTLDQLAVQAGERFIVQLAGEGNAPGDPDLYLKFEAPALLSDFDCRPFEAGAEEVCDVIVPAGSSVASVMVHAASDSRFRVAVMGAHD
jgi:serine protease